MSIESYIKDLDPELQKKARACDNAEELLALARENKIPVPDEVLAAIAGGDNADPENCAKPTCPKCGHHEGPSTRTPNPFPVHLHPNCRR